MHCMTREPQIELLRDCFAFERAIQAIGKELAVELRNFESITGRGIEFTLADMRTH